MPKITQNTLQTTSVVNNAFKVFRLPTIWGRARPKRLSRPERDCARLARRLYRRFSRRCRLRGAHSSAHSPKFAAPLRADWDLSPAFAPVNHHIMPVVRFLNLLFFNLLFCCAHLVSFQPGKPLSNFAPCKLAMQNFLHLGALKMCSRRGRSTLSLTK